MEEVKRGKKPFIGFLLSVALFCAACGINIQLFTVELPGLGYLPFRDLLLVIGLICIYWTLYRFRWFERWDILKKLKQFGFVVLLLWFLILSIHFFFPGSFIAEYELHPDSLKDHFVLTMFMYFVCFFGVWILLSLKDLIYVQQGKKTSRYYRFFIFLLVLQVLSSPFGFAESRIIIMPIGIEYGHPGLDYALIGLMILFMVLNGFRCKWIHYLNRNQKVGIFFLFILLFISALSLQIRQSIIMIYDFSENLGTFINYLILFLLIYTGIAMLGILLQLPAAGLMDKKRREIHSFQTLSATLGSVLDRDELISRITRLSTQFVGADCAWLEVKENSKYVLAGTHGIKTELVEQIPENTMSNLRKTVHEHESVVLLNDLPKDRRFNEIKKWKHQAGSLLIAPVHYKTKDLGLLYALKSETFGYIDESRDSFQALANQVAVALENVNLVQVTIDQERYREELRLAHEAQMRLLPQEMPQIKGIEIDGFCLTANDIGGDFYDIIPVRQDRIDIVIGDVSGKGASAAFYMAELKGMIQTLAYHYTSPKEILLEMNKYLHTHFDQQTFVTMVYGILLPRKKQIQLVRAGHPPIGHIRKQKVSWIESKGLGLGLSANKVFTKSLQERTVKLQKGDTVVFYTDGLTEARNSEEDEYGEERLTQSLSEIQSLPSHEIVEQIHKRMEQFTEGISRHDDITLVVFKVL